MYAVCARPRGQRTLGAVPCMSGDFDGLDDIIDGVVLISKAGGVNATGDERCLCVEEQGLAGGARGVEVRLVFWMIRGLILAIVAIAGTTSLHGTCGESGSGLKSYEARVPALYVWNNNCNKKPIPFTNGPFSSGGC
jgi:hypothetical protein